ncbi:hypothetical protein ACFYSC_34470 [Streptosporangium sp. NPDC004379]|uniref:hypothetical protein n=1 Tax=Streptosporangium sp. NPDC004379 TaxID=3366189 RepID=UPI0036D0BEBC
MAGLFLLVKAPMWVNDAKLDSLIERFEDHPLPPKTYWAGNDAEGSIALRGNGNHCDYRARFTLSTELPIEELLAHYKRADIAGVESSRPSITAWIRPSSEQSVHGPRPVLVELNDGTDAGLDIRCH